MKTLNLVLLLLFIFITQGCTQEKAKNIKINAAGNDIRTRIPAPAGYAWVNEEPNSFGLFLQNVELKEDGSHILDYRGQSISNQAEHIAILNYDVGTRDLQQCADAVIRLRAEYLFERGMFSKIGFHFTNGDFFTWNQFKEGIRTVPDGNTVSYKQNKKFDDSYQNFRKYLNEIYNYAGTISLNKETIKVSNNDKIKAGDILVTPGSPGHALIIVGKAVKNNKSVYLLAEGYTPAQSIHIITNATQDINPWYELDVNSGSTETARYTFRPTNIRSF